MAGHRRRHHIADGTQGQGLPFGLTWWSFTFPVGTCVTGTIGLADRTGADLLRYGAVGLFLLLLAAWLIVAIRTVHGGATGRLFLPGAGAAEVRAEGAVASTNME